MPLHPLAEAATRVAFAYLRDQHGMRASRPLGLYLARSTYFLLAGRIVPALEARMSGLHVVVSTADRTIARSVYACGDWDPLLVGTVFDALDRWGHAYRGTTFVEIGANFGVYSLPAVVDYGFDLAIAYEPEPAAFKLLSRNIARNGLAGRVRAVPRALSKRPGSVLLSRSSNNAGDNRIVRGSALDGADSIAVHASTFDEEVAGGTIRLSEVGLVWLDVQGHEAEVLAGARSLLATDIPVVLEYSTVMMSRTDRQLLHEIVADNYRAVVDLGWAALTGRIRFQPAWAIRQLVPAGRALETDLLLL